MIQFFVDYVLWGIAIAPSVLFFFASTAAFAAVAALFGADDETAIGIGAAFALVAPLLVGLAGWGIGALFGVTVALIFGGVIALLISGFGGWVLWALRHEEV